MKQNTFQSQEESLKEFAKIHHTELTVSFLRFEVCLFIFIGIPGVNIMGYGINLFIASSISLFINLREVQKHIYLDLSLSNIIIFILLSILTFIILKTLTANILNNYMIIKNIIIILITFLTFSLLSFFGVEE